MKIWLTTHVGEKNQKFPRKFRGKGLTIYFFAAIIERRIGKNRPAKTKIF